MKLIFKYLLPAVCLLSTSAMAICSQNMSVSSETQLNAAIECFNIGLADQTISLNFSFRATDSLEVIDPKTSHELTIEGNRKRIISTSLSGNILEVASGSLVINDLILLNTAGSGVVASGNAELHVYDSTIKGGDQGISVESASARASLFNSLILDSGTYGISLISGDINITDSTIDNSDKTGIYSNSGSLIISNSTISNGHYGGVYLQGGDAVIKHSTISGNRLNGIDLIQGEILISNSTVSENRIGIFADNGTASIGNSTIAYNRDNGLETDGGLIKVYSSLVAFNAQSGPYRDCLQYSGNLVFVGPANSSFNSDGSCRSFNAANAVSATKIGSSDLLGFGDYGCTSKHRTLAGSRCTKVHPLSESSIAVERGACRAVNGSPAIPKVLDDQRGEVRPAKCATGATELVATPAAVAIISPSARIQDTTPLIQWTEDASGRAQKYRILIRDSQNENLINKVVPVSTLTKDGDVYNYDTGLSFEPGVYRVWVIAINPEGRSPYSRRSRFIVADTTLPGTVSVIAPRGTTSGSTPVLEWSKDSHNAARAYRIVIRDSANTVLFNQTLMLSELIETGAAFSYDTGVNFSPGTYRVWVRGVNFSGNGPNSSRSVFRVP